MLGKVGGVLAVVGVVVCPITSGYTAFRSARLILAEWSGLDQKSMKNRLIITLPLLAVGARWHHERYDGRGYPDGLHDERIPEEARIIAVADSYDAMTSNRSYRGIMSQERVREELEKGKGTQFDPRFVEIMLSMMAEDTDFKMRET